MKKLFTMLLVTMLCVSMLSTAALADGRTPITWTAFTSEKQEIDGLVVWDTIEDMFNVDIKLQRYETSDYETKTNLALTSMDMGDLWVYRNTADLNMYGDMGAFVNLMDYKDKLVNYFATIDKFADEFENYSLFSPEGGLYGAFRIYDLKYAHEGVMIRKDIVEKLGYKLEDIKTREDLTEVLYAMKAAYPDSTPLTGRWGMNYMMQIGLRGNNVNTTTLYDVYDKTYKYTGISDEMKEVVEWYRQLMADGICVNNFSISDDEWLSDVLNGKSFVFYDYANECSNVNLKGRTVDPDFTMTDIRMPTWGERQITPLSAWSVYALDSLAIPSNSKNIDKMIEIIDFLYSDEGILLTNFGVEGVTFQYDENGTPRYMEPIVAPYNEGTVTRNEYGLCWTGELCRFLSYDSYHYAMEDTTKEALECTRADSLPKYNWPTLVWTEDEKNARADLQTPINTFVNENLAKFVVGEKDMSEWDDFVAQAKELGVDKLVDMYNTKLAETVK